MYSLLILHLEDYIEDSLQEVYVSLAGFLGVGVLEDCCEDLLEDLGCWGCCGSWSECYFVVVLVLV